MLSVGISQEGIKRIDENVAAPEIGRTTSAWLSSAYSVDNHNYLFAGFVNNSKSNSQIYKHTLATRWGVTPGEMSYSQFRVKSNVFARFLGKRALVWTSETKWANYDSL